jgi:antitoxin component of MazEF toxin-antitoxin module
MTKKLIKHGNSLALLIEKPVLNILGFDEKTELIVAIKDGALIISSAKVKKSKSNDKELDEITERIIKKYEPVIKRLART